MKNDDVIASFGLLVKLMKQGIWSSLLGVTMVQFIADTHNI